MHTSTFLFRILFVGIAFELMLPIVSTYLEDHDIPALLGFTFVLWVFLPLTFLLQDRLKKHPFLNRMAEAVFMVMMPLPVNCIQVPL